LLLITWMPAHTGKLAPPSAASYAAFVRTVSNLIASNWTTPVVRYVVPSEVCWLPTRTLSPATKVNVLVVTNAKVPPGISACMSTW
jgi:hypothetical protein